MSSEQQMKKIIIKKTNEKRPHTKKTKTQNTNNTTLEQENTQDVKILEKENTQTINSDKEIKKHRRRILLVIVNKILQNVNKEQIDDVRKFINIEREDILNTKNNLILNEMEQEILLYFNNNKYMQLKNPKQKKILLNFLKNACMESGYNFSYSKQEDIIFVNEKKYRRTVFLYSIQ
ncbi:hypothetical protein Hokovirus_1_325 [Hokovirus HKV1]|uniref:Uncharacterized protein n=1 Tax=Hokovirus HKV1 TaxID=1977638 RepID=A0A1V0SFE7_9VIRU|nr:hypothetical protein Hokovirus_1_325 [Hokovirus HKV1]